MPRSANVSRLRAAMSPAVMASGAVISIANNASLSERNNAGPTSPLHTSVVWFFQENPKSNVTRPFSTRPYWLRNGSWRPSLIRKRLDRGLRCLRTGQRSSRVARQQLHHEEHDRDHQPQCDQ